MLFYALIIPALLATLYMIWRVRNLRKHDQVLYKFCQLRRDTLALITEHNFKLAKNDYLALRELEDMTSSTIHDFNKCKTSLFNFRKFSDYVRRAESVERELNKGEDLKDGLMTLRLKYVAAMAYAFFTFTPFLKFEVVLRVLPVLIKVFAAIGGRYVKNQAKRMTEILSWARREKDTPDLFGQT